MGLGQFVNQPGFMVGHELPSLEIVLGSRDQWKPARLDLRTMKFQ